MFRIHFTKFDEQGYPRLEFAGKNRKTLRECMEMLERNGFHPARPKVKRRYVWYHGNGMKAVVQKVL